MASPSETARERRARYRPRMREQGLRPVQIWVPDATAPGFEAECNRQAQLINCMAGESAELDFIENVADWGDE